MKTDWEVKKLGDLCEVITKGTTPTSIGYSFVQKGVNFIKIESIDSNRNFLPTKFAAINVDCHQALKRSQLKKGDILFSIAGALGRTVLVSEDILPANTNQALAIIRLKPSSEISTSFILLTLESSIVLDQIAKFKGGAAQQNLSLEQVRSFEFPLPPLLEQQRIVAILGEAFAAIDKAKGNAQRNLQNARALFDSYLQSVFANPGEGWEEKSLQEVVDSRCTLSYGIVQPGDEFPDGLPIIRPTDLTSKFISLNGLKLINPQLAESYKRTTLMGNELLLCVRGNTGVISIATRELAGGNVTRGIVPICFKSVIMSVEFGYYQFISQFIHKQIKAKTYGTALMQINIGDLRKISVLVPTIEEQQTIVAKLDVLSAETKKLEAIYQQKLTDLDELKKAILQKAFQGELTNVQTNALAV